MYVAKGGATNISKGVLVIIKVQKVENLNRLVRNTVVVHGVVLSKPKASSTNDIKLWHMCLRYIGECGMLELHKINMLKGVRTCKLNFSSIVCVERNTESVSRPVLILVRGFLDYVHSDVWGANENFCS